MELNVKKLSEWAERIHNNASAHGFHDERKPDEHWLCMVMTEIAEAVEADRKGSKANTEGFKKMMLYGHDFEVTYRDYIKGSIEEEFADIVIRLLDFINEKYYNSMDWDCYYYGAKAFKEYSFTQNAYRLLASLKADTEHLLDALYFMYSWAGLYDIDLDFHIEMKMRYNESRPIKHGKRY